MAKNTLDQYISSIKREPLSIEEENKFVRIYQNKEDGWQQAQDKIVRNNLLLVVKLALQLTKQESTVLDLISEGNLALLQSLNKFDPNKGFKLSSFAAFRIKGSFAAFFKKHNRYRHFKLSDENITLAEKAKKFSEDYFYQNNINPSVREIAKHCQINEAKALMITELANISTVVLDKPLELLDGQIESEIADPNIKDPFNQVNNKENNIIISKIIASLPAKHQIIVNKRFGLNGEDRTDLASIGKELNITKERVRQVESSILKTIHKQLEKLSLND